MALDGDCLQIHSLLSSKSVTSMSVTLKDKFVNSVTSSSYHSTRFILSRTVGQSCGVSRQFCPIAVHLLRHYSISKCSVKTQTVSRLHVFCLILVHCPRSQFRIRGDHDYDESTCVAPVAFKKQKKVNSQMLSILTSANPVKNWGACRSCN